MSIVITHWHNVKLLNESGTKGRADPGGHSEFKTPIPLSPNSASYLSLLRREVLAIWIGLKPCHFGGHDGFGLTEYYVINYLHSNSTIVTPSVSL
jgi:hypothetical protein